MRAVLSVPLLYHFAVRSRLEMRRDLFEWRYGRVVATPKAWTAGCEATEGRSYGTILSEKPGGKSTSRSA